MRKFLQFIKANLEEREKDFEDSYVKQLQDSSLKIKQDREAEEQYMSLALNALLMDERDEGKAEGIAETVLEFLNALVPMFITTLSQTRMKSRFLAADEYISPKKSNSVGASWLKPSRKIAHLRLSSPPYIMEAQRRQAR